MIVQDDQPFANTEKRSDIIQDLLKNKPSGPGNVEIKYSQAQEWDPTKNKMITKSIPSHPYYGYDKRTLFNLGIRTIEDVRRVLRKHNFGGKYVIGSKKRTYTRQCNRLWNRISPAIKSVIQEGGKGVYRVVHKKVRSSYTLRETSVGFVYAVNYKEATNLSRLMFGYLVSDPENLETVFARFGTEESLYAYNQKAVEKIDARLKEMSDTRKHMDAKIKKLESMKQAVLNVTLSMCNPHEE